MSDIYVLVDYFIFQDEGIGGLMIRTMIDRCIAEKRPVRVYCSLGNDGFSYVTGVITEYGVLNDSIRVVTTGAETVIPINSVHSISFDGK